MSGYVVSEKKKIRGAVNLHELPAESAETVSDQIRNGVERNAL